MPQQMMCREKIIKKRAEMHQTIFNIMKTNYRSFWSEKSMRTKRQDCI